MCMLGDMFFIRWNDGKGPRRRVRWKSSGQGQRHPQRHSGSAKSDSRSLSQRQDFGYDGGRGSRSRKPWDEPERSSTPGAFSSGWQISKPSLSPRSSIQHRSRQSLVARHRRTYDPQQYCSVDTWLAASSGCGARLHAGSSFEVEMESRYRILLLPTRSRDWVSEPLLHFSKRAAPESNSF
jgi:hypothetical protein